MSDFAVEDDQLVDVPDTVTDPITDYRLDNFKIRALELAHSMQRQIRADATQIVADAEEFLTFLIGDSKQDDDKD